MAWYGYSRWAPYVPVARRRADAARYAKNLAKKEKRALSPISIEGRAIASSFWGKAWCDHLETYSDFENRLPRGRTYVRNGSVIDLTIKKGKIEALVSGSNVYKIAIDIKTLEKAAWTRLKQECARSIASLIDLLQGRFDHGIMERLADPQGGLFPRSADISMKCSCPDWAGLCKHLAAVLYGVGARLDTAPELLFTLRNVDHLELISQAVAEENLDQTLASGQDAALAGSDLGELFGIDLDVGQSESAQSPPKKKAPRAKRTKIAKASQQAPSGKARKPAAKPRKAAAKKVAVPSVANGRRAVKPATRRKAK